MISFRYPDSWLTKKHKYHTTEEFYEKWKSWIENSACAFVSRISEIDFVKRLKITFKFV